MRSTLVFCGFGLGAALDLLNAWLSASNHRAGTWTWMLACVLALIVCAIGVQELPGTAKQNRNKAKSLAGGQNKNRMKIFQYIALTKAGAISPAALLAVIQPAVGGLQSTFGVSIPPALVTDIVTDVADAINAFHKKAAA